jgi:hypothetical protein
MLAGRFALVCVERPHPVAGIVSDLTSEEEFWLVDEGMEATAPVGMKMATRVYAPEDFHMTAGVIVPPDGILVMTAFERRPLLLRMSPDQAAQDRRFAEAIYREAIQTGVMERIRFQFPLGSAEAVG